jgi:type VI secretion system secreted protein Hcp
MAAHMFIKLDDIKGESVDDKHKGEIDILSWSWGVAQTGTAHGGGGSGAGKGQVNDLTFTKQVDRSSPLLFQLCCSGTPLKKGLLTCCKAGGKALEYIKIGMDQVMVTSVTIGGDVGGDVINETVTLNFATMNYEYVPQKADGSGEASVSKGWDIAGNKPV